MARLMSGTAMARPNEGKNPGDSDRRATIGSVSGHLPPRSATAVAQRGKSARHHHSDNGQDLQAQDDERDDSDEFPKRPLLAERHFQIKHRSGIDQNADAVRILPELEPGINVEK